MRRSNKLLLMTTSDRKSDRGADLARLIRSVAARRPGIFDVQHLILLQRCSETQRLAAQRDVPYPATVLATAARLPLSAARNAMLARARAKGLLGSDTVVAFPDDDCWYTPEFPARVIDLFRQQQDLGLLVTRMSLAPSVDWDARANRTATVRDVLRRSTSNGIFLRGNVAEAIGDFDVRLGLGTPSTSGEDTDYALRASFVAHKTIYVDLPLVGHHEPDLASVTKYFGGNMMVAARYALRSPTFFLEYARKFGVGSYLVLDNRLRMSDFVGAIQGSMRTLGRSSARAEAMSRAHADNVVSMSGSIPVGLEEQARTDAAVG